jgi:hypothetical protein
MDFDAEHRSLVSERAGARPRVRWLAMRTTLDSCSSEIPFRSSRWNISPSLAFLNPCEVFMEAIMGRGILLWLLGVPIPVIILLWLFFGH